MFELTDEHYQPKKMVVAKITYMVDVNKDNIFIGQLEDFDLEDGTEEDYEDLKMSEEQVYNTVVNDLIETIYNSVKYNDVHNLIDVEFIDV